MGNYILWARKREPGAQWFDMPYHQRSLDDAIDLVHYYEGEWGNLYEYEIHRGGYFATYPEGTRKPCFVGVN